MLNEFLAIVASALRGLPAWLYWALGILALTFAAVIWFFRTQLHIQTKPHLPARAWGRLAVGVTLCVWNWALFLVWPWLNWHDPSLLFGAEVPRGIGLVVVLGTLTLLALFWLYHFTFVENGNSRFWLKVIKLHEAPCLWVLGSSHRATYDLHLRWRFVLWGETQAMRWQEGNLIRALKRQRWLGLLLAGGAAVGVLVGSLAWVHDEPLEAIRNALFPTDPAHAASAGVWSLFSVAVAAPVAFALWKFRDTNQLWQIENQRKDTNLKDFQQLCEWASGMHLVEDSVSTQTTVGKKERTATQSKPPVGEDQTPNRREGSLAMQVLAIYQLEGYLMGEYGQQFKRPAFVLLMSLWEQLVKGWTPSSNNFPDESLVKLINTPLGKAIERCLLVQKGKALREHTGLLRWRRLIGLGLADSSFDFQDHLSNLDLRLINLSGTLLLRTRLEGTNLSGARLEHAFLFGAQLQDALLTNTHFDHSDLSIANLSGATLNGAQIQSTIMCISRLEGAILNNVGVNEETDFTNASTDATTQVYVRAGPLALESDVIPPIPTHALRLKLRKVNHLKLDPSAYREFRSVWLGISKAERKAIYDKAYAYSENPDQFSKDFPHLA